jgi:hypothetical protein
MATDRFASGPRFGRGNLAALLTVLCAVGWAAFVAYLVIFDRHTPAAGITLSCGSTLEHIVGALASVAWVGPLAGVVMAVVAFVRRTDLKIRVGAALLACVLLLPIAVVFVSAGYGCDAPV